MVAILEKIKLIIQNDRLLYVSTPLGEKSCDYISEGTYIFEKGKIYGLVSEHGGGGDGICCLLSGEAPLDKEKIIIDNREISTIDEFGWYVGKPIYTNGLIKKEATIKKSLNKAIKKYRRYNNLEEIIEMFHLSKDKLDYKFSNNSMWEMWRSSLALGYASRKSIFCFPWMNTLTFYDCMYNSGVFRFFKMLKEEGAIIILPTSREENLINFADITIRITNPRFQHVISESDYFKNNF